jgi:hypothetical protein
MIPGDAFFGRHVAEDGLGLLVVSSHALIVVPDRVHVDPGYAAFFSKLPRP